MICKTLPVPSFSPARYPSGPVRVGDKVCSISSELLFVFGLESRVCYWLGFRPSSSLGHQLARFWGSDLSLRPIYGGVHCRIISTSNRLRIIRHMVNLFIKGKTVGCLLSLCTCPEAYSELAKETIFFSPDIFRPIKPIFYTFALCLPYLSSNA